jgi:hypothetical protein
MVAPHLYQQYYAQHLNYDPQTDYVCNLRLFSLGETHLIMTDLETKTVEELAYADIRSVRLDYRTESIGGSSHDNSKKIFYCSLNETHDIASKRLDILVLFEYENDTNYNIFIQALHQKLTVFPNVARIYHSNYSPADFDLSVRISFVFFLLLSVFFYFIQQQAWYLCTQEYDCIIFIAIIWAATYHIWRIKPEFYAPSSIPTKYLS